MMSKFVLLALVAAALTACASHHASRVRCDKHLEPINIRVAQPPVSLDKAAP